jgi:DNA topoisomerase-1
MPKNLVIVESPAKARTIERFLGNDYIVKSSFGHIRDLPKKGLNVDIEHDFMPRYEISSDKKTVVQDLKKLAKDTNVLLASDEDREGEAIAWHLTQALNLDPAKTQRIVFHEITKPAIEEAIKNPRTVDLHLVDAQQARRVLDRLVGYELSPMLWKKVRTGLSAGRVQSVAVRLIVEREREIRNFNSVSSFKINALFSSGQLEIPATLNAAIDDYNSVAEWLKLTSQADFNVKAAETKPARRSPSPPFTTSTLQQEAARRLGFSVRQTMTLAQRLYEAGLITYMRTDSTTLSSLAIGSVGDYINKVYGDKYHQVRQYRTKNLNAQEAHEAIRPTDVGLTSIQGDQTERKLYDLIWRRTVASQMTDANISRSELDISISNQSQYFIAKGEVLEFDGFLKVYGGSKDDVILPKIEIGQKLSLNQLQAKEQFSRAPTRYGEAGLVRKLEDLGIGRPSTYAPTISTIQSRGYVEKTDVIGEPRQIRVLTIRPDGPIQDSEETESYGANRAKLIPTPIAEVVTDFLVKYFPAVIDYDFTAKVEEDFDEIALGKRQWNKMIADFYRGFHPLIEKTEELSRHEVSQARLVGADPKSSKPIYARFGRYGPMLQRGETTDETKPEFAALPDGTTIENVTLEQALVMFQLPRLVGKTGKGEDILANIGRFGPYVKVGALSVSIRGYDPHTINEAEANLLYEEKLKKEAEKNIKELNNGIKIINGPYGPYVTNGKKNAKIDKSMDPKAIDQKTAEDLLAKAPQKRRRIQRKKNK